MSGNDVGELADEVERLRARVARLEARLVDDDSLLDHDVVRRWIDDAASASKYDSARVWDVVGLLAGQAPGEFASSEDLSAEVELARSSTAELLQYLDRTDVVSSRKDPDDRRRNQYALNRDSIRDLVRVAESG